MDGSGSPEKGPPIPPSIPPDWSPPPPEGPLICLSIKQITTTAAHGRFSIHSPGLPGLPARFLAAVVWLRLSAAFPLPCLPARGQTASPRNRQRPKHFPNFPQLRSEPIRRRTP
ncbi:hypothetical protein CONLIGDRAFT_635943 [Coniochaeta ligniaria NRRL 30616]|uniref:Uncharacterized protein n=1 Tax=Coniochaeta ligniaria NRRL 30616 TaxID=1408157 RepID=A0A1J7IBG6_9PEZI|nr:hypothetical protein CONLIGDRAFT_635943 [Coniochaeta ligniaria NRRL 30616]